MAIEHPWPEANGVAADFSDVEITPYRPGRIETSAGLRGRPHLIEQGRKYWRIAGTIPATDDEELAARISEMLSVVSAGSEVFTRMPFHWPSFAENGAVGGDGTISIRGVLQTRGGVTGIQLKQSAPGFADVANGNIRRLPEVGDFFKVGPQERLVQVSAVSQIGNARPAIDFEADLQLEVAPDDPVLAPDTVRVQLEQDGNTPYSPDWYGPWSVRFVEFIPDPLEAIPNQLLDRQYDLPDLEGRVGDQLTLRLAPVWVDPAGGDITYWVRADGGIKITESGDAAYTLTLETAGSHTVTVRATEADGTWDEQSFLVEVGERDGNRPPDILRIIPAVSITLGRSIHIEGANHFDDPDGDELRFEADIEDPTVARRVVNGGVITYIGTRVGTTLGTIRAVDTSGRSVSLVFPITVGAIVSDRPIPGGDPNRPRVIQRFTPLSLIASYPGRPGIGEVRGSPHTYDNLYEFYEDPNGEELEFSATAGLLPNGRPAVAASVVGSALTISPLFNTGTVQVTVTARNRKRRTSISQTISVTVNAPANRAPLWNGPGSQVLGNALSEDTATEANPVESRTIRLVDRSDPQAHCYDPDGDDITLAVKSVTPSGILTATISNDDSVLLFRTLSASRNGGAVVVLTATDNGNPAMSKDHSIRVRAVASGSTVAPDPGITINTGHSVFDPMALVYPGLDGNRSLESQAGAVWSIASGNTGGPDVDYDAVSSDASVCRAEMDGSDLEVTPTGPGRATVSGTIRTRTGNTTPGEWSIEVTVEEADVPSEPEWDGPSSEDVALVLGQAKPALNLDDYCTDEDGRTITYSLILGGTTAPAKFTAALSGTRNRMLTLTPVGTTVDAVPVFLRLRATTSAGSTDHNVRVRVTASPEVPVSTGLTVTAIPDFPRSGETFYAGRNYDLDIRPYFTPGAAGLPVDWARTEVERVSGNPTTYARSQRNGIIRLLAGGRAGVTRFRVRAYEADTGNRTAWQSFDVTVSLQPVARVVISRIGNRRVVFGQSQELDIADFTSYAGPGGKAGLRYGVIVEYSTGGRAQGVVSLSGSVLTLGGEGVPLGFYKITVVVAPRANVVLYTTQTFYLSVRSTGGGGGGGTEPEPPQN